MMDTNVKRCPYCAGGGSVCSTCQQANMKVTRKGKFQQVRAECGPEKLPHQWRTCSKCGGAGLIKRGKS